MRYALIILFSVFSLSASAQWWHINFNKKREPLPMLKPVKDNSLSRLITSTNNKKSIDIIVHTVDLGQSQLSLEAQEASIIKTAKHNMRFRVYHEASYNFSDLAQVYIQLHRLSEAKWYFLQSNQISREENDDKHTISNLVALAGVKVDIGDIASARADINEALDLARTKGFLITMAQIQTKIQAMDQSLTYSITPLAELKYAESTGSEKKAL